jgi:hypothetical protein
MDPEVYRLIAALHQTSCSCVLAITGGGATSAGWLLAVPGASQTILDIQIPYSEDSLCEFLGKRPEGFCEETTCVDMAEAAWSRAMMGRPGSRCVGVGCTASLATTRPKRGAHRFYAALTAEGVVRIQSLQFVKGARSRAEEEEVVARTILNLLAEAAGVNERLELRLEPNEVLKEETWDRSTPLLGFLRREVRRLCVEQDGRVRRDAVAPRVLLPGSFNPLHEGHCTLARLAASRVQSPAAFEMSIANVDKPRLGLAEIRRRLIQFHGRSAVWLTDAPTFVEKARLFPGCQFVVGLDTAARIVAPQYYEGGSSGMERGAEEIRNAGCCFLVAARANRDGKLVGLEDMLIPACFSGLFEAIPKSLFSMAISSSALRERRLAGVDSPAD